MILAFLSTIAAAQATVIEFNLSPTGTDAAVGLRPANETSVVTSTGSGNEISRGISFDTATSTLTLAIGYGSSAGFTDLTGASTALHIHGPAATGVAAPVLFDLAPVHFPAAIPANGGIIYGSVVYAPAQATELLAGHNYVNIHTAAYPGGEIRGQLVPVPDVAPVITSISVTPNVLWPANHKMVAVQVSAVVTDTGPTTWRIMSISSSEAVDAPGSGHTSPDWTITGDTTAMLRAERTGKSPTGRVYTITVQATDGAGNHSALSTVTVTVPHNH